MVAEKIAKILLNENAVTLSLDPPYTYSSGILSPIYCDNRLLTGSVEQRKEIVEQFVNLVKEHNIDVEIIMGTATAGISWAAWIAEKLELPMAYVRGQAKGHGKGKQIEGANVEGKKVLIIEDLVSTGKSSLNAVSAVREAGGQIEYCFAIFNYQLEKAKTGFKEANCELLTLTDFSTLINLAEELSDEDKEKAREWNKDPENWGVKWISQKNSE